MLDFSVKIAVVRVFRLSIVHDLLDYRLLCMAFLIFEIDIPASTTWGEALEPRLLTDQEGSASTVSLLFVYLYEIGQDLLL